MLTAAALAEIPPPGRSPAEAKATGRPGVDTGRIGVVLVGRNEEVTGRTEDAGRMEVEKGRMLDVVSGRDGVGDGRDPPPEMDDMKIPC